MLIYVCENKGVYEPLVDRKEDGTMYVPYWDTKNVLGAQAEGEKRGYVRCGAKLAYIRYETYRELKEKLAEVTSKCSNILAALKALNPLEKSDLRVDQFMARNADILQYSGDSWLSPNDTGECVLIDKEAAEYLQNKWMEEHPETEDWDEDDYEDYEDDEDDEDEEDEESDESEDPDVKAAIEKRLTAMALADLAKEGEEEDLLNFLEKLMG